MRIIINGLEAALKKNSSFEFVSENRMFTGSDSYSLAMAFPLKDCPQNQKIFGNICRIDVQKSEIVLDCEIFDGNFYKSGVVTVTEIDDAEVKTQFLEGRSQQNFLRNFDEIFINELDLGEPAVSSTSVNVADAWRGLDFGHPYVALPWVNNASGNIQNDVVFADGAYHWAPNTKELSCQPYLIFIAKKICEAVGYAFDFSEWESDDRRKYIIICNALPRAWDDARFASALPHWSVSEFFAKLERCIDGEFDIDHKAKKIKFTFTGNILKNIPSVLLDNIVDAWSAEVGPDDESKFIGTALLKYADCSHNMWKFYSCDWFIREKRNFAVEYSCVDDLIKDNMHLRKVRNYSRGSNINKLLHAQMEEMYFVIRCIRTEDGTDERGNKITWKICELQPVNLFGESSGGNESENSVELDFVPAWIEDTDAAKGHCIFLDVGGTGKHSPSDPPADETIFQPISVQQLTNGEKSKSSEYFDKIYIACWNDNHIFRGKLPCPAVDFLTFNEDWDYSYTDFSLRLNNNSMHELPLDINPKVKYHFSFIANDIPDVRAVFYIRGQKYLCEKITATLTENGMSQLLKGTFFEVVG